MNKFLNIFLSIVSFGVLMILWLFVFLISSDIPVSISKNEFIISLVSLFLFGLLYSFYMKKFKRRVVDILILIPLLFWLFDMINAIKHNYQLYHNIIVATGFAITVYCAGLSIYGLTKNK